MNAIDQKLLSGCRTPVAILGGGVSGRAVADLLKRLDCPHIIYDERSVDGANPEFTLGNASGGPLVVYSPGFAPDHAWILRARAAGCPCLSEFDFAAHFFRGKAYAVTGTNGKTTLVEFLAGAFKNIGREAHAVGNNGRPLSSLAGRTNNENLLAICEVSSFQAETLRHIRFDVLLWTNFQEDHLDRHSSMERYFAAKWNLLNQLDGTDFLAGESVSNASKRYGLKLPSFATIVPEVDESPWSLPEDSAFSTGTQVANLRLARQFWKMKGLPDKILMSCAESFPARKHRLNRVCEIEGVSLWNDSKATNFAAARAALETFARPVHWIGGGRHGGGALTRFARHMASRVKAAYLIGDTAHPLANEFRRACAPATVFRNLKEAVWEAFRAAQPGDTILFSPGFSSLDMFENYAHRGKFFEKTVLGLKKIHLDS